jgi:chromatin structure-remodeling complex subunit RSC9
MNPAQLLHHITSVHLSASPTSCAWSTCTAPSGSTSHMLTHLPMPRQRTVPDMITSNPRAESWLSRPDVTNRPPPNLPSGYKLHFTALSTPTDQRTRQPMGVAFLAALLVRNLAKVLRTEMASSRADSGRLEGHEAKKRKTKNEKFGLPIPELVLKEEEEEERAMQGADADLTEGKLNWEERERARAAFEALEERIGEIVAGNLSGLGQYLGDAWGW